MGAITHPLSLGAFRTRQANKSLQKETQNASLKKIRGKYRMHSWRLITLPRYRDGKMLMNGR